MTANYEPIHRLKFKLSSAGLINIRVSINNDIKVIQCRTNMDFIIPISINTCNIIQIENLTDNIACNIDEVWLNYLNITPVMHEFTSTYTKIDNIQIGKFVPDIFSPDSCIIRIDQYVYNQLFPYFINKGIDF